MVFARRSSIWRLHQRIAFITGPLSLKSAVARRNSFLQSIREIGLTCDPLLIVEGDHTTEGGVAAAAQILNSPNQPTAILCPNDMTAIGVMKRGNEGGMVIPRDLSLVGFDDVRLARYMLPPPTDGADVADRPGHVAFRALLADIGRVEPLSNGTESEPLVDDDPATRKSVCQATLTQHVGSRSIGLTAQAGGQGDLENRTLGDGFSPQTTAVRFNNRATDRQSHPDALRFGRKE
jgi:hypothetical protein